MGGRDGPGRLVGRPGPSYVRGRPANRTLGASCQ